MKDINIYLTQENLEAIKRELHELETVQRPKAIEEVTIARGHGDLSENFEFLAARTELERINRRIAELKGILIYAQTVTRIATDVVGVGTRFIATSVRKGVVTTKMYELVGYADYHKTIAAIEDSSKPIPVTAGSPFGKAVCDKKAGEVYTYTDPDHNKVTGEVISIMSELEVQPTTDKVYTK